MNVLPELIRRVFAEQAKAAGRRLRLMEVCGSHSFAIAKAGLRALLPDSIELLSGPGCPVCVSGEDFISRTILLIQHGCRVALFGDLLRIPSPLGTPGEQKGVLVIYSPEEVLDYAVAHPEENVVFAAVGFEPTLSAASVVLETAKQHGLSNFSMLCDFKNMRPVLDVLCQDPECRPDGFLLPGHVASVTGWECFKGLPVPGVVAGFTPENILSALAELIPLAAEKKPEIRNHYPSAVEAAGNTEALRLIRSCFAVCDGEWRGLGIVPNGNWRIRDEYREFDAMERFPFLKEPLPPHSANGCKCGEVLRGRIHPEQCPLFDKICTPEHPVGACMVSVEGACAASWYHREVTK